MKKIPKGRCLHIPDAPPHHPAGMLGPGEGHVQEPEVLRHLLPEFQVEVMLQAPGAEVEDGPVFIFRQVALGRGLSGAMEGSVPEVRKIDHRVLQALRFMDGHNPDGPGVAFKPELGGIRCVSPAGPLAFEPPEKSAGESAESSQTEMFGGIPDAETTKTKAPAGDAPGASEEK